MTRPGPEALLADLIGFDTVTGTGNAQLLAFVTSYLEAHGVEARTMWAADGERGNLIASIGPPGVPGGVILAGHTDVVPAEREQWRSDPFEAVIRGDRLYGRGAADMKGFIAGVLAALPTLVTTSLARPVHLLFTYDEETDCAGVRHFLSSDEVTRLEAGCVVLGEPTDLSPVTRHRAHRHLKTVIHGRQAHGGFAWRGTSAIAVGGQLIAALYDRFSGWHAADLTAATETTSVNIGVIAGGDQFNVAAGSCRFDWELRPALGDGGQGILEAFERRCRDIESLHGARGAPVTIETTLLESYPEYRAAENSPAVALVRDITGSSTRGVIGAGTEAPFFETHGLPTVIFGPGSIGQAHQPDEYVELAQLDSCAEFVRALARHLAA